MLMVSNEERFLGAVSAANENRFNGWELINVHREIGNELAEVKAYPFDPDEVLPSWKRLKSMVEHPKLSTLL